MFFKKRKRLPVVFVHGIMGAMGDGILGSNGELNFGMSEAIYRPFIDNLKDLGYIENKDLFICFYDWTKESINSVNKYLIPTIDKAKQISNSEYVDIIGHSMGGLVARTYAQGEDYRYDINKLIMIATPNSGSVNAYYFWSGGELVKKESYKNLLYRIIKKSFMWYAHFIYKKNIDIEFLRQQIPSVRQLLPSFEYGDYLMLEETSKDIPIETMNIENEFLNKLNNHKGILKERRIKIYMIIGKNIDTIEKIKVKKQEKESEKWLDGKPIDNIKTNLGDGTVICKSMESIEAKKIYIDSDHTEILSNCKNQLAYILNIKRSIALEVNNKEAFNIIYSIIAKNIEDIKINANRDCYNVISKQISTDVSWIIIKAKSIDNIKLNVHPLSYDGELIIYKGNINTGIIEEENIDINKTLTESIRL